MKTYDVAVLGMGTMGSASVLELRRRNVSVIGFDQFAPPHAYGSHSGATRVFRLAHYDNPKYVPLAKRAGKLWDSLSVEVGKSLVNRIGLLKMGPETDGLISGIRKSSEEFQIPVERLTASEVGYRYPAFRIPDQYVGYLEHTAGWIDVPAAITGMQNRARDLGAELCLNHRVDSWESDGRVARIKLEGREVIAEKIVITAGAWTTQLLQGLNLPIHLVRKAFLFFDPLEPEKFSDRAIPLFGFPSNIFYAFPNIGGMGVKVAEHLGGERVDRPDAPSEEENYASILETVTRYMPALAGPRPGDISRISRIDTCLYSLTPDENFILDLHPEFPNVVFAGGFSGHGFKFTPVIGEVMADLALEGSTRLPVEFLRLRNHSMGEDRRSTLV
jgi:monomeric sarcosine oxidase